MSEPQLRAKVRRGLLKVEPLHALARAVYYGQQGRISAREVYDPVNACSCLTLILACIVYGQAREISPIAPAPDFPFDPDLLPHVSPIEWNNVILYGEIKIDPAKLKLRVPWCVFLHESGRYQTLQQWGGGDAAFKRLNELKRQLSPEEEVPKEAVTATVTSPIDSHSIWHSIRLTGIDFESLNWGQIVPPGAKTSCPKDAPDSEGGLGQL